ncbi:MAG TPA: TauD/TfdA family dioxygenase [Polyangia bacterium]|nr:TauD/TfdA family dioxygenase [Polyangia bacterium]
MFSELPAEPASRPPLPVVLKAARSRISVGDWVRDNRARIDAVLKESGAVLLRGFSVDATRFAEVTATICGRAEPYLYRSTPRTAVGTNIYTATEYPQTLAIPMHCENAYQRSWPMRLLFWCEIPSVTGGETPLADVSQVTSRIPRDIVDEFAARQIRYVRNYSVGIDLPWQTVFQTQDRSTVESYCAAAGIQFEWLPNGNLRTSQICQGVATHPETGDRVWFNQAHLFHVSSLDPASRSAMLSLYREEDLPRNAYFGDGAAIPSDMLAAVRSAFDAERTAISWHAGDVMVIDNMRVAHGRNPFSGRRRVLVGMGAPYAPAGDAAIGAPV